MCGFEAVVAFCHSLSLFVILALSPTLYFSSLLRPKIKNGGRHGGGGGDIDVVFCIYNYLKKMEENLKKMETKMEIVWLPIESLKPTEYNPKGLNKEEYQNLKDSIESFGMVEPIVVNTYPGRENIIVGGHQRYYICKDLKHKLMPCVYVYLPLEEERELNVRLTKNTGHWDWSLLANFDEALLEKIGFNQYELNEIFDIALSKAEVTAEAEENKRELILNFDACKDIDDAERQMKDLIKSLGIKARLTC